MVALTHVLYLLVASVNLNVVHCSRLPQETGLDQCPSSPSTGQPSLDGSMASHLNWLVAGPGDPTPSRKRKRESDSDQPAPDRYLTKRFKNFRISDKPANSNANWHTASETDDPHLQNCKSPVATTPITDPNPDLGPADPSLDDIEQLLNASSAAQLTFAHLLQLGPFRLPQLDYTLVGPSVLVSLDVEQIKELWEMVQAPHLLAQIPTLFFLYLSPAQVYHAHLTGPKKSSEALVKRVFLLDDDLVPPSNWTKAVTRQLDLILANPKYPHMPKYQLREAKQILKISKPPRAQSPYFYLRIQQFEAGVDAALANTQIKTTAALQDQSNQFSNLLKLFNID